MASLPRRHARSAACALVALAAVLALAGTAVAHPIHGGCGQAGVQDWHAAYVAQFDINDPDTWTSGIILVNAGITCCEYWDEYDPDTILPVGC